MCPPGYGIDPEMLRTLAAKMEISQRERNANRMPVNLGKEGSRPKTPPLPDRVTIVLSPPAGSRMIA